MKPFSRRKLIALIVGILAGLVLLAALALTDDARAQEQPEAAASAYCSIWTPKIQFQISPVTGELRMGVNGQLLPTAPRNQVRVGDVIYGEFEWYSQTTIVFVNFYEDGVEVAKVQVYLPCVDFDFEAKGNIEVVDAVQVSDGIKVTFLVNPLPAYITASPLIVSGIVDSKPFYSLQATVDRRVGLWSFFTATIPGPIGSGLVVSTASATMDGRYFGLANSGVVRVRKPYSICLPFVAR